MRKPLVRAGVIAALALGVRTAAFFANYPALPFYVMPPDAHEYHRLARALVQTGEFVDPSGRAGQTRRVPLFPAFLALIYSQSGDDARAAAVAGIVVSALTVGLTAFLAGWLSGPWASWTAGLVLILDTGSLLSSHQLLTETLFTFFLVAALAVATLWVERRPPAAWVGAALGAAVGAAGLTRPIGLPLIVIIVAWLLLVSRRDGWTPARRAVLAAAACAGWGVGVGSWALHNSRSQQALTVSDGPGKYLLLTRGADVLAQVRHSTYDEAHASLVAEVDEISRRTGRRRGDIYMGLAVDVIQRHPGRFVWAQLRWLPKLLFEPAAVNLRPGATLARRAHVLCELAHLTIVYMAAAIGLCHALGAGRSRRRRLAPLIALLLVYFVLASTGPHGSSRFRVPMMPLLALASAPVFAAWWRGSPPRTQGRATADVAVA